MQSPYGGVHLGPYGHTVDYLADEQNLKRVRKMEKREAVERRRRQKRRRSRIKQDRKSS